MVQFPAGLHLERLTRAHPRSRFRCGETPVDRWLATKALQHQVKQLSATKVLIDELGEIAGYYTLATSQIDFGDLPTELTRQLPRRSLPVAVLAWLGVSTNRQGQGIGGRLVAQALHDCHRAGETFAFVAVILDCLNDAAKSFYEQWNFRELPGHPYRLFLGTKRLDAMMRGP